ncbi:hypothetical protein GCM10010193_68000 [Kitasatospora atroaurantiaca]|uniref:hypothetical protein n=1 Tax=Kitasatospora atroaurantiaca TaxID=285545 RepID=UPI00119D17BE|nr:hypothetical protein [Kitasatospora atroaurantiaca]
MAQGGFGGADLRCARFCDGLIGAAYPDGTLHAISAALVDWYASAGRRLRPGGLPRCTCPDL